MVLYGCFAPVYSYMTSTWPAGAGMVMATILWAHTVPLYSIQLSALLALRQDRPLSVSNFLEMSQKMTKKVQPHTSIDKSRMNQMINHREIE